MKKSNISKMILSGFLTVCVAAVAGCGSSSETSSQQAPDVSGTSSEVQSIAEVSKEESSDGSVPADSSDEASKSEKSGISVSQDDHGQELITDTEDDPDEESSGNTSSEPESETDRASASDKSENEENDDKDGNIVIMLDPGHDDDESPRNHKKLGVNEQDLNLKIGLACYDRLSEYEGVTPYLTRTDGHCPNADKEFSGVKDCIHKRAHMAEEKDADFFVSLHCDALDEDFGTEANGVAVYITNYPEYSSKCEKLGNIIIDHITEAVDLKSRGVFLNELDEEKGTYKDGTTKDKLYLLSYNVDYGRPALIVEHGFMDNEHDNAILRDDEKLKLIGQADADAIAEYYGLKLK